MKNWLTTWRGKLGLALCGLLVLTGCLTDASPAVLAISHEPQTMQQMRHLVMPEDPAVKETLAIILATPVVSDSLLQTTILLNDFDHIRDWIADNIAYISDAEAHGVDDYWQTPAETLVRRAGDCEDEAILLCSLLRANGVPPDTVFVAVGTDGIDIRHAYLLEHYVKGIWRMMDARSVETDIVDGIPSTYQTAYCFNDRRSFRGDPGLPAGSYEFEVGDSSYPLGESATHVYYRRLKTGQTVTVNVNWLADSVYANCNVNIRYPWSFSMYDLSGQAVYTWSGMDLARAFTFTPATAGIYKLEVLKRDGPARCVRMTIAPQTWTRVPPDGVSFPATSPPLIPLSTVSSPPPTVAAHTTPSPELVAYTLELVNAQLAAEDLPPVPLGRNQAAQAHAEDMLAYEYLSYWDTSGLNTLMRYNLAGGAGNPSEYISLARLNGADAGDMAVLKSAVACALQVVMVNSKFDQFGALPTAFVQASNPETIEFKFTGGKCVNIGLAYNTSYLFLAVQFEFEGEATFDRLPSIQNGILSFSCHGVDAGTQSVSSAMIYYNPPPASLTAGQLNMAGAAGYSRPVAWVWESRIHSKDANFSYPAYPDPFNFPQEVIAGLPPGNAVTVNPQPLSSVRVTIINLNALVWPSQANGFLFSVDISHIIAACGTGVYTVTCGYVSKADVLSYLRYPLFVSNPSL